MQLIARLISVFVTVIVVVQDQAEGVPLYRRQDVNSEHYLDSPRRQAIEYDEGSELPLSDASYGMEPDLTRLKEGRNKLTPEELVRQARRERNQMLLGATNTADDLETEARGVTRYVAKYGTRESKTGEDTRNTRPRQNLSPELDYEDEDSLDDAATSHVTSYNKYNYKRLETKTPEPLRGASKNTDLKYKLGNGNGQSTPSEEIESYDIKTLSAIIKNLRSESQAVDKTPNAEEGRRVGGFAKEREGAKVRTNSGGLQRTDVKPQGYVNLEDYAISKTNRKSWNVDQVTGRKEVEAREHVLKLLTELEKLEELKSLQGDLDTEYDSAQYYELKHEIADDLKNIRNRVRQKIRANQQVM